MIDISGHLIHLYHCWSPVTCQLSNCGLYGPSYMCAQKMVSNSW